MFVPTPLPFYPLPTWLFEHRLQRATLALAFTRIPVAVRIPVPMPTRLPRRLWHARCLPCIALHTMPRCCGLPTFCLGLCCHIYAAINLSSSPSSLHGSVCYLWTYHHLCASPGEARSRYTVYTLYRRVSLTHPPPPAWRSPSTHFYGIPFSTAHSHTQLRTPRP